MHSAALCVVGTGPSVAPWIGETGMGEGPSALEEVLLARKAEGYCLPDHVSNSDCLGFGCILLTVPWSDCCSFSPRISATPF